MKLMIQIYEFATCFSAKICKIYLNFAQNFEKESKIDTLCCRLLLYTHKGETHNPRYCILATKYEIVCCRFFPSYQYPGFSLFCVLVVVTYY